MLRPDRGALGEIGNNLQQYIDQSYQSYHEGANRGKFGTRLPRQEATSSSNSHCVDKPTYAKVGLGSDSVSHPVAIGCTVFVRSSKGLVDK